MEILGNRHLPQIQFYKRTPYSIVADNDMESATINRVRRSWERLYREIKFSGGVGVVPARVDSKDSGILNSFEESTMIPKGYERT